MDCFGLLGKRIKEVRKQKRYTQENLAEMVETTAQHISNIENGRTKLSIGLFIKLANALDVSADVLMCDCVPVKEESLNREFIFVTKDCTDTERRFLLEYVKSMIELMRKNEK